MKDQETYWEWAKRQTRELANSEAAQTLGHGVLNVWSLIRGSSKWRWIFSSLLLVAVCLGIWALYKSTSGASMLSYTAKKAAEKTVSAELTEQGTVPIARHTDSSKASPIEVEKVPALRPEEIDATVTVGSGNVPSVILRRKDPWFPELRSKGAALDAELWCPEEALPECRNVPVTVTPNPRPFLEVSPEATLGINSSLSGPQMGLSDPNLFVGADLLRAGPVHGQFGLAVDPDSLSGLGVDFAPGVAIELKENVMLTGHRMWHEEEWVYGVAVKF